MSFLEKFRVIYRKTRGYAAMGKIVETAAGCLELSAFCSEHYSSKNIPIIEKAKLRYYTKLFKDYTNVLQERGFTSDIMKLFGLSESDIVLRSTTKPSPQIKEVERIANISEPTATIDEIIDSINSSSQDKVEVQPESREVDYDPIDSVNKIDNDYGIKIIETEKAGKYFQNISGEELAPQTLDEFIGQQKVIESLKISIEAATKRGDKYLENIMLFGSRGLGKTTLMGLIAKELGVRFEHLDCTQFRNDSRSQTAVQKFFQRLGTENQPVVVGLDEIHAFPERFQDGLLTLMDLKKFIYMDDEGVNQIIPIDNLTFIGATTNPGKVKKTLRDRSNYLTFFLKDYTEDELRVIFNNNLNVKRLKADYDTISECINRCRGSIREINAIIKGLSDLADIAETDIIDMNMVLNYFTNKAVDPIGLREKDIEILTALRNDSTSVMSEETLAASVGLDPKEYRLVYEAYLLKIRFIAITGRGRILTEEAREYLARFD